MTIKIALSQSASTPGDVSANLALLAEVAQNAANQSADFLILPELFLTGYNIGDQAWSLAEPVDGPSLNTAAKIAQACQLTILLGYSEVSDGQFYNSAALINAAGQLVANYRKIHLYGPEERRLFVPGDQWLLHPVAGVNVGVLICYDVEFPEAVRTLAQQGAELIAVPTALSTPSPEVPTALAVAKTLIPARALENQVFVAYVNHAGAERDMTYCGLSCLASPDGSELARAGAEATLLIAEIDPQMIARERAVYSYLNERRPELYRKN